MVSDVTEIELPARIDPVCRRRRPRRASMVLLRDQSRGRRPRAASGGKL